VAARDEWDGGFVRRTGAGKVIYVIRRQVGGRRYEVSTRCSTLRAAMAELARFEADPAAYLPGGPARPEPVLLTVDLGKAFLEWSRDAKGNTDRWVRNQAAHLEWWRGHLKGIDLRNAPIEKIEKPLKNTPSRPHKIIVLKAFYSWLVQVERKLKPTEDPTFRTLKVPQAKPEQRRRNKATSQGDYLAVREQLLELSKEKGGGGKPAFAPFWIDALDVLAGTGWHVTELERFAKGGAVEARESEGVAGILTCPRTKGGSPLRTAVSAVVLEAAKRIRAKGEFKGDALRTALKRAAKRPGFPRINPGSFRHSVATHAISSGAEAGHSVPTHAISSGAEAGATADFLGHRSEATTKKFYATHAVPVKVPTLI